MFNAVPGGWMRRAWFLNPWARTMANLLSTTFTSVVILQKLGCICVLLEKAGGGGNPTIQIWVANSRFALPIVLVSLWGRHTIEDVTVRFAEPTPVPFPYHRWEEPINSECVNTIQHNTRTLDLFNCIPSTRVAHTRVENIPPSSYMHANSHRWLSDSPCSRDIGVIIPRVH